MENNWRENIQKYIDLIVKHTGKSCSANFDGLLAIVKYDGQIIFTSAGGFGDHRIKMVETLLGGMVVGLNIGITQERGKNENYYSLRN